MMMSVTIIRLFIRTLSGILLCICSGPSILTSHRRPSFRKGMRYAASGTMRPLCCSSESAASAWQTTQRTSAVLSLICWHSVELMYAPSGADRTASRSCSVMFDARKAIHLRESSVQFPYASSKRRLNNLPQIP